MAYLKKKIQALRKINLETRIDSKSLEKDEVAIVKFENQAQYDALLTFGHFKEFHRQVPVIGKPVLDIPVLKKSVIEDKEILEEKKETFICKICERVFKTSKGLQNHMEKIHPVKDKSTKPVIRNCSNCGTIMVITGESNIPSEGIKTTFSCPVCNEMEVV